jgi:hypothetical protein
MKFILRLLIVIALSGGIVLAAGRGAVGADPSNENQPASAIGSVDLSPLSNNGAAGTVKPPPSPVIITEDGKYSVGGICTIQVEGLSDEYGLKAYAISRERLGPLPTEAIRILSGTCYIQYQERTPNVNLMQLPGGVGNVTVCFAHIPPNKQGQVYSYDLVDKVWTRLATFVEKITPSNRDIACAPAMQSKAYALLQVRE